MSFQFRPAKRENVPLLIGLAGGTGSGKTMSAMEMAKGLAGGAKFAVVDTENGRAKHYADQYTFDHADLTAPFRPERYAEAIEAADAAGYPVIVVDSMSHEWAGDGGMLDWHEEEYQRLGAREAVKMSAWIKPKAAHKKMVTRLLQVRAHVILCFRAEAKVEMVKDNDGKWVIVPKRSLVGLDGWIPITEKTLPYELTLSFLFVADQPGLPKPIKLQEQHRPFFPLDAKVSDGTGMALAQWARGSAASAPAAAEVAVNDEERQELTARLVELADQLGVAETTAHATAKNRGLHADDPGSHMAWLKTQIAKAETKVAALEETAGVEAEQSAFPIPETAR